MMDTRTFFFEENASNICDHVYSIRYTILPPPPSLPSSLPPELASSEFFLPSFDFEIIPLPHPPSWLQSCEMKRETFLHDPRETLAPLFLSSRRREEESAMLSRNVTRSTSPRFRIFMRRFVYWISLLVYRVKLEIGIRREGGGRRTNFFSRIIDPL